MTIEKININVLYFAKLGEDLGCSNEQIKLDLSSTLNTLIQNLTSRGSPWDLLLAPEIRCAVNQEISRENLTLHDGDEIAFFPPVTGG